MILALGASGHGFDPRSGPFSNLKRLGGTRGRKGNKRNPIEQGKRAIQWQLTNETPLNGIIIYFILLCLT